MRLFAVGISHRSAPVELRECVDFARRGLEPALAALAERKAAHEVVVLSTCNRAEIYAAADSDGASPTRARPLHRRIPRRPLGAAGAARRRLPRRRTRRDHLFRVAAGLDSLVVGEPQILGQVKEAFATAERRQGDRRAHQPSLHAPRSASASACAPRPGSAKAPCRSATPRSRWRKKIFGDLKRLQRPDPRRRRDGEAHRRAPAGAGRARS